jgi:short subunit dehydrogenase-like uncharacterized protein
VIERTSSRPSVPGPRRSELWGRVSDARGLAVEGRLTTPQAYQLTARTAVECATRAADGRTEPGAHMPAQAFGADFISEFEGCELRLHV